MGLLEQIQEEETARLSEALPAWTVTGDPVTGYAALAAGQKTIIVTDPDLTGLSYSQVTAQIEVWAISPTQDIEKARADLSEALTVLISEGMDRAYSVGATPPGTTRYYPAYKIHYNQEWSI